MMVQKQSKCLLTVSFELYPIPLDFFEFFDGGPSFLRLQLPHAQLTQFVLPHIVLLLLSLLPYLFSLQGGAELFLLQLTCLAWSSG